MNTEKQPAVGGQVDGAVERPVPERDALHTVARQVLRDMQAQGVLVAWQTLLADALGISARPKTWVCPSCGTDRLTADCPKGYGTSLAGHCLMPVEQK